MEPPPRTTIVCDAGAIGADFGGIERLARLQLEARRRGRDLRFTNASPELRGLVEFAGLGGVLCLEPGGEVEERKEPFGVEEERQLGDPAA
jgi:hypothetical protein